MYAGNDGGVQNDSDGTENDKWDEYNEHASQEIHTDQGGTEDTRDADSEGGGWRHLFVYKYIDSTTKRRLHSLRIDLRPVIKVIVEGVHSSMSQ